MQYCYKAMENIVVVQAMTGVMQHQARAFKNGVTDLTFSPFAPIKRMALDFLRFVDGYALETITLLRLADKDKIERAALKKDGWAHFVIVLHAPAPAMLYTSGDETVNLRTGEAWWFDRTTDNLLINNSGEDVVIMPMDIRVD